MKYTIIMYDRKGHSVKLGTLIASNSDEAYAKAKARNPGRNVYVRWNDGIPAVIDYSLPDPLPEVEYGGVVYPEPIASGSF